MERIIKETFINMPEYSKLDVLARFHLEKKKQNNM